MLVIAKIIGLLLWLITVVLVSFVVVKKLIIESVIYLTKVIKKLRNYPKFMQNPYNEEYYEKYISDILPDSSQQNLSVSLNLITKIL